MNKIKKSDHFYLIDGSGYIFRAYYALPPLSRKSDGMPTGAVNGFCNMLFKLLEDSKSKENLQKPTHFAVIFDSARKNFRNEIYKDYKANRSDAPDDLIPQFDFIRKSVMAFNLPSVELINYEADDLIATYVEQILKIGAKVTIVSSDKDLMQLFSKNVRIYDPMKNKFLGEEDVIKKFGVKSDKVIDVQSLAGDTSDNVPGVPGIGVKTAAELINKYGNLEKLLSKAHEIKQNKRRETILENKDKALISKKLVTLKKDVPIKIKQAYFEAVVTDTIRTQSIDGVPQRVINTGMVQNLERNRYLKFPRAAKNALKFRQVTNTSFLDLLREAIAMKKNQEMTWAQIALAANAPMLTKATMVNGNYEIGIMPTGVGLGVIESAPTVLEIIEEIMAEASQCLRDLTASEEKN